MASGSSSRPQQGVWKHPDQPYLYAMIVLDSSKIVLLAELGDYVSFPMKTQKAAATSERTVCHFYNSLSLPQEEQVHFQFLLLNSLNCFCYWHKK